MNKTKFMEVMFSAVENNDEELTDQVAGEIESAKNSESGEVDLGEVTYINLGNGKVMVIDNVNQECTIVEGQGDEYEMEAMPDEEIEKYIHTLDGTTPDDNIQDGDVENVEEHEPTGTADNTNNVDPSDMCSQALSKNIAGASDNVAPEDSDFCPECEEEEREFSVSTRNTAVIKFFSDQMFYERMMSEVIDSEDTAKVGNIQIDKVGDGEVVVTDTESGDAAKVTIDGDELEVEELDEKNFKEFSALTEEDAQDQEAEMPEQHEPMFVVGYAPDSHVVVDAPVYDEEDAQELAEHLAEMGVTGTQLFENPDEAREYASELFQTEGAVDADEPEQAEFSDRELYLTRYYSADEVDGEEYSIFSDPEVDFSDCTDFMIRMFSEAENGNSETQDVIEDAIESGEQIEDDEHIITPVDSETAVVEDKNSGEFTKATLNGEDIDVEKISEDEASDLTDKVNVEDEKEFSEVCTRFMHKLFSEENDECPASQSKVEDAIESGEQIEDDDVVITPVDSETAVVEDKANDEVTKVTLDGEGLDVEAITEGEANELLNKVNIEDNSEDEETEEEEHEFSEPTDTLSKFFADATEEMVTVQVPASALAQAVPVEEGPEMVQQVPADQDPAAVAADQQVPVDNGQSVEAIEDKAIAAVNSIQEAAQQAVEMIQEAKEAPVAGSDQDIQEAQFSETEKSFADTKESNVFTDPMAGWLSQI